MEPGVIDLNDMTDEQLSVLVEDARRELAGRQTRTAIARDLTVAVDRVIGPNLNLMGEGWESGRVAWDGERVTVEALSPDEYLDLDFPEPEPEPDEPSAPVRDWKAGMSVAAGDRIRYQDVVYVVVQAHMTAAHWVPDSLPSLYRVEG